MQKDALKEMPLQNINEEVSWQRHVLMRDFSKIKKEHNDDAATQY